MNNIQINSRDTVITSLKQRRITINSIDYEIPLEVLKNPNNSSVSIINGQVFIGFEFDLKKKKFRRSLRALFHLFF